MKLIPLALTLLPLLPFAVSLSSKANARRSMKRELTKYILIGSDGTTVDQSDYSSDTSTIYEANESDPLVKLVDDGLSFLDSSIPGDSSLYAFYPSLSGSSFIQSNHATL